VSPVAQGGDGGAQEVGGAEPTASAFLARLQAEATEEQRVAYRRYFPGDESFIGVRMGTVFAIAKEYLGMPLRETRPCWRVRCTKHARARAR
jgi:hypothetical protein